MKKQIIPVSPIQIGNTPGGSLEIRIKTQLASAIASAVQYRYVTR